MLLENKNIEKEWLKKLQKELITNRLNENGNADPLYYTIRDYKKIEVPDGCGDEIQVYDYDETESYTLEQFIINKLNSDYTKDMLLENEDIMSEIDIQYENGFISEYVSDIEIHNAGNLVRELEDLFPEIRVCEVADEPYFVENEIFLTRKHAENHLKANRHHYTKDAHTYGMTSQRSYEYEHLIKLLHEIDWDKSNIELKIPIGWLNENQLMTILKLKNNKLDKKDCKYKIDEFTKNYKYYRTKDNINYYPKESKYELLDREFLKETPIFIPKNVYKKIIKDNKLKKPNETKGMVLIPIKYVYEDIYEFIILKSDGKKWTYQIKNKYTTIKEGDLNSDYIDIQKDKYYSYVFVNEENIDNPIVKLPKIW